MTVIARFFSVPEYKFRIDRTCYFPAPKVHGALATFKLQAPAARPAVRNDREFLSFVRQAFSAKRKMIGNALQPGWLKDDVCAALECIGLSRQVCLHLQQTVPAAPRVLSRLPLNNALV